MKKQILPRRATMLSKRLLQQIEELLRRNPRARVGIQLFLTGSAIYSEIVGARYLDLTGALAPVANERLDLTLALALLWLVPWIFGVIALVTAISAGYMVFAAFSNERENLKFNIYLLRGSLIGALVATALLGSAKFFLWRFETVDLVSMQLASNEEQRIEHLTIHERALLLSAIYGDRFMAKRLSPRLNRDVQQILILQPADRDDVAQIIRASLVSGTKPAAGVGPVI